MRRLLREDIVEGDALVHQYWMRSFQDPSLFTDPLTAALRESARYPEGYEALYRLASAVADPIAFGEWVGVALMAVSGWLVFAIVREHATWRAAPWLAGALFLALDIHRFSGGFPRGFLHPVVLGTVLLALRGRRLGAAVVASGGALLYPPAALLATGTLLASAAGWRDRRPRIDPHRARWGLVALAGTLVAVGVPQLLAGAPSDVMTAAQARAFPEFGPQGGLPFFVPSPVAFLRQNRSGFDLAGTGSLLVLAALALLLLRPSTLRRLRPEVLALPVVALAFFALAHAVLFRLYLPHRYTYPLVAFLAIAVAVALEPAWRAVRARERPWAGAFALLLGPVGLLLVALHAFPLGPLVPPAGLATPAAAAGLGAAVVLAAAAATVLGRLPPARGAATGALVTGVALLAALLAVPDRRSPGSGCPERPVTAFLAGLPKDAIVAGDPSDLKCVPMTASRAVVISSQLAPSYEAGYFLEGRRRMADMLRAYYGRSPGPLAGLHSRYGATHLWVRRNAIRRETAAPRGVRWRQHKRPWGALVRRLAAAGTPAVLDLPAACRRFRDGAEEVYDVRCLAATTTATARPAAAPRGRRPLPPRTPRGGRG